MNDVAAAYVENRIPQTCNLLADLVLNEDGDVLRYSLESLGGRRLWYPPMENFRAEREKNRKARWPLPAKGINPRETVQVAATG